MQGLWTGQMGQVTKTVADVHWWAVLVAANGFDPDGTRAFIKPERPPQAVPKAGAV